MIENGMVMPTDVNFDRKRQRKVVFYGRVSTEHEAQLAALENQIQWYDDIAAKNPNWYILKKYIDEEIIYGEQKIINLRNRSYFFTENINELLEHKPKTIEKKWRICYTIKKIICGILQKALL